MTQNQDLERRALKLSVAGAAVMAGLGIGFAFLTRSEAILLDGFFSLINFAMGVLSLKVARLVSQPDDEHFQFGYASFEPFLNLSKGLLFGLLCLIALYSAVDALFHGGRPIASGWALLYAVLVVAACFLIAWGQRHAATKTGSPLVEVDAKGWVLDGLITSAVCVAFIILVLIEKTAWSVYTPYADPLIVILLVVFSAPIPINIVRSNVRELLLAAPDAELQTKIRGKLQAATQDLPLDRTVIRMVKVGRHTYLHIYVVVAASDRGADINNLDEVRERINVELAGVVPGLSVDVIFTGSERWVNIPPPSAGSRT
jgi:cation diffusion facilitator family transporter